MIEHGRLSTIGERRRAPAALATFPRRDARGPFVPAGELTRAGEMIPLSRGREPQHEPGFETVHAGAGSALTHEGQSHEASGAETGWHYHPELELSWVRAGCGTRFVGDSVAPFEVGDLVLIGPDLPHSYQQEEGDPHPLARETIHFSPDRFGLEFFELAEMRIIGELLRNADQGWQIRGRSAERVRDLMRNMSGKSALRRLIGLLQILETLAQAEADLTPLASYDYLSRSANPARSHRVEAIRTYVRENLSEDINQAHAAQLVGLTPSAFSRFFRKSTGLTFVQFVNQLRIGEACRMLAETDCGITEIAFGCGYWSIANFNRQFLRIKGMNPTRFREKLIRSLGGRDRRATIAGVMAPRAPAIGEGLCHTG